MQMGFTSLKRRQRHQLLNALRDAESMTLSERLEMEAILRAGDLLQKHILKIFHVPTMPRRHAYAMADVGSEATEGFDQQIIDDYEAAKAKAQDNQGRANKQKRDAAAGRRHTNCSQNYP